VQHGLVLIKIYGAMKRTFLLLALVLALGAYAQEAHHDTTYKNTIRLNITPMLLNDVGTFVVGYERIIKPNQSFSVNVGRLRLPSLLGSEDSTGFLAKDINRNEGFSFAADYRFYATKRNKYAIPDGLYWGPFVTYYYYDNNTTVYLDNNAYQGNAELQSYMGLLMIGAQLGYQFVIKDRWTIDLILAGPAVGFYSIDMRLKADVALDDDLEVIEDVLDEIFAMFPGLNVLVDEQQLKASGGNTTWGGGFRYVIQVGYRF